MEIILSAKPDSKMFAKLVNDQRKATKITQTLIGNGKVCDTPDEICNGWAEHYAQFTSPLESENFDEKH